MIKLGANKWGFFEEHIIGRVGVWLYMMATLLVVVEALRRYIFAAAFYWASDIVIYFFLVAGYLYLATCGKVGGHLRVSFLVERLNPRLRNTISNIILLVSFAYCVILVVGLIPAIQIALGAGFTTENARIPFALIFALLGVGFLLFAIRYGIQAYHQIKGSESKEETEKWSG